MNDGVRRPDRDALTRDALGESTQRNLLTAAWGLGGVYAVFVLMHAALLPSRSGVILVSLTAASSVWFFAFAACYRRLGRAPAPARARVFAGAFAYIVLANVTTHFVLMGEMWHGYNFTLYQVGAGALILSRRWLIGVLVSTFVVAVVSAGVAIDHVDWPLAIGGLIGATGIGYLVHVVRVRMLTQLVWLKRDAEVALVAARESAEAMRRVQTNLREIIEHHPDGTVVHRDGVIAFANAAFAAALRAPSNDSLVGKSLVDLVAAPAVAPFADALARSDGQPEVSFVRADNEEVILELSPPQPVVFEDAPATLTVARDVTQRHADQHAKLLLSDRMSAVGTLAAGVAHEINNPLAFMLMNLAVLDEELRNPAIPIPSAKRAELLEMIADCLTGGERVKSTVTDLKGMSRVESVAPSEIDVRDPLRASIKMAANEIRHRCRLVENIEPVPSVFANSARLGQVFLNMIINAVQALPEGYCRDHHVAVATRKDAGRVVVEISDTGGGMTEETRRRMFEPFFTTKRVGVGTGLGLYYCHKAILDEGGEIEVDSELGCGTTFRILLPAASRRRRQTAKTWADDGDREQRRRLRVLVIDDEPALGRSLERLLRQQNCDVTVASSGVGGLELFQSESFDLVFCDVMIPDVSGLDIYAAIRSLRKGLEDRIVFITGGTFSDETGELLANLDNPVLLKPFEPDQLDEVIGRLVAP